MMTNSSINPPCWMQAAVSFLLPPAYRETVLGDLQERFRERGAGARWLGYLGDVVTTVPQVLGSHMRRMVTRIAMRPPFPVTCGAVRNTSRRRSGSAMPPFLSASCWSSGSSCSMPGVRGSSTNQ